MNSNAAEDIQTLLAAKDKRIAELEADLQNVLTQFRELKRHVFGRKSEKLEVVSLNQQQMFEHPLPEVVVTAETEVCSHKRRLKRNGRRALSPELPRERIEYEPEERNCSGCGTELSKIGEDVTEELDYVPARFVIREHVKIKRACSKCKDEVVSGELPAGVPIIEKGRPGAGLLAHVFLSKYCDALPLHRQEQMFARYGVKLSKNTMCDWVRAGSDLLERIAKEVLVENLEAKAIAADETPMKAQTAEKMGLHTGYIWGVLGPAGVYFHYAKTRSGEVAKSLLKGFKGFVHTDAYAGYNPIFLPDECTRVACFAHVRRKFVEVQKLAKRDVNTILQLIAQLYGIEKQIRGKPPAFRLNLRQKESVPRLCKLKEFLDALNTRTLPQHPLKKAIEYALNQWDSLLVYTTNGLLEMDTNAIERQIRSIAVGRKNYLFVGSHDGGRRAAIMYTLINSCKLHGVNPYDYLVDVLRRVHTHPVTRIRELLPAHWKNIFS